MIELPTEGQVADHQHKFTRQDLIDLTNQHIDWLRHLIQDLPDPFVTFVPHDPDAHDQYAADQANVDIAWTLGHNILHVTASSEEGTARGSSLARGITPKERSRYEPDWQTVTTIPQLLQRLAESRRLRLAFLDTWPDQPHLDLTFDFGNQRLVERFGKPNAVGIVLFGLRHEASHFAQMQEIIRQAHTSSQNSP